MSCEGSKKAKLIVSSDGKDTGFLFNTAPIFVACKNNNNEDSICSNYAFSFEYDAYQDDLVTFARTAGNTFDIAGRPIAIRTLDNKNLQILRPVCSNGIYQNATYWYSLGASIYATTRNARITNIVPKVAPSGNIPKKRGIVVKDKFGNTLLDDNSLECIYQIICDDDCPEGSHKCTHAEYPGYCCVPCKEVGDKLKNMANKVGR